MGAHFIGPYQIIRQLGQGSTATVYLAYDSNMDRQVAVKTYDPRFTHDPLFKPIHQRSSILTTKYAISHFTFWCRRSFIPCYLSSTSLRIA